MSPQVSLCRDLDQVPAAAWNALHGTDCPFLRHEFLAALEHSGCVGDTTGWRPHHLLLHDARHRLVGAMPLYLKHDASGEFVFDWAWADAYRQAGLAYYPKLVCAVPFTPAGGTRLLHAATRRDEARRTLLDAARALAIDNGLSSFHVLFPDDEEATWLDTQGLLLRKDCQFHWHQRGWVNFEDFLGDFTASKRKKVRRERRRVQEAGITFRHYAGDEIDDDLWQALLPLYARTFWLRGRPPYLNGAFFKEISRTLPGALLAVVALHGGAPVACALFFRSATTLYGRYWGSSGDWHSLHFETCYHQGIEYCLTHGLSRFEPGTQGEHKISRGFVPQPTWSAHWLSDARFASAIDRWLDRERDHVERYMDAIGAHVPYRGDPH